MFGALSVIRRSREKSQDLKKKLFSQWFDTKTVGAKLPKRTKCTQTCWLLSITISGNSQGAQSYKLTYLNQVRDLLFKNTRCGDLIVPNSGHPAHDEVNRHAIKTLSRSCPVSDRLQYHEEPARPPHLSSCSIVPCCCGSLR